MDVVTHAEYSRLLEKIEDAKRRLREAEKEKAEAHLSAGDPDMHENSAAETAYEEIRKWAGELGRLNRILSSIIVGEKILKNDGTVQIGSSVTVLIDEIDEYTRVMAGPQGKFSEGEIASTSKLGLKIIGNRVGFEASYESGTGQTVSVKLLNIVNG